MVYVSVTTLLRTYSHVLTHSCSQWPPPPRATPLIVPSHLTSASEPSQEEAEESRDSGTATPTALWSVDRSRPGTSRGNTKSRAKAKSSSLHRAVMQKLEVKKALAGD